MGYKFC